MVVAVKEYLVKKEFAPKVSKDEGMEYAIAMKESRRIEQREYIPANKIVGSFGIIEPSGFEHVVNWSIHGQRRDKRHGPIDKPEHISKYAKTLLDGMFKGW